MCRQSPGVERRLCLIPFTAPSISESEALSGCVLFTTPNRRSSSASSFRTFRSVRICSVTVGAASDRDAAEPMRSACRDNSRAANPAGTRSWVTRSNTDPTSANAKSAATAPSMANAEMLKKASNSRLCLPEIRSGYIDDAIRPGAAPTECDRKHGLREAMVHPCSATSAFELDCSRLRNSEVNGADAARRRQRRDQGSPAGSSRSAFRSSRSAMAIAPRSADRGCPSLEDAGPKRRHRSRPGREECSVAYSPIRRPR